GDAAGGDGVDADAILADFVRDAAGEVDDGGFAGGVDVAAIADADAGDAGGGDDGAGALGAHDAGGVLHSHDDGVEEDIHGVLHAIEIGIGDGAGFAAEARVVEHEVQAAEAA